MHRLLAVVTLLLAVGFAVSPLFSDGFNGFEPSQFPVEQDFWPVQPAGWAFSIWGVIFLWLIAGAGFGLWRRAEAPDWQAMRWPLAVSLFVGMFWIAVANAAPVIATVMIVVMWITAVAAFLRAGRRDPLWQVAPVGLYAGWLTAATGVAIGVVAGGYGWLSAQAAALLCLTGVLAVAVGVQTARRDSWAYPLAVGWALLGVVAANLPSRNLPVIALALAGILLLGYRHFTRKDMP
ncbi:tryptophan-rich sensory protein [uncultured Paracoccus sp.]|uniref:tryptophan-rich sensory protein n=1 Tax=uncultured Paracoccus sp. TaxID=189685 RepID=UPI00260312AE|nr:tryptophan-rich sensory protein [uncultured Paracoccus sp.]